MRLLAYWFFAYRAGIDTQANTLLKNTSGLPGYINLMRQHSFQVDAVRRIVA